MRTTVCSGARRALLSAAALVLLLGGCREHAGLDDMTARTLTNHETRHPIGYSSRTEALYVEVAPSGDGLSANQTTDVYRFVQRYKVEGKGRLTVTAPSSAKGHLNASRSIRQVMDIVADAGLPSEAVSQVRPRNGEGRYGSAVRLAYERPVAIAPQCGDWPEDLGENRERRPYANFGCATQRNLALSVANSRDLQHSQEEAAGAGERRTAMWTKYTGSPSSGGGGGAAAPVAPAATPPPGAPGAPKP